MSSFYYGTEYKLQGKWVAKDNESAEFGGERTSIEVDDASAPKVSFETAGEEYYPQTLRTWHEDRLRWEIEDEIFTFHVLSGPGGLEYPYQKYVTIENPKSKARRHYKLVEITEEEYEDTREWYKSVEDKIWCADSRWESLPTKDRIDNEDIATLSADEKGFIIKGTALYGYDESIGGPTVKVPDGIKRMKAGAFRNCQSIVRVHIPDSVSSIGDGCFDGCKNLVSVRLPEGLTQIYDEMFRNCVSLKEISLPSTVISIGRDSFDSCISLEDAVMPEGLTIIGDRAFRAATSLKRLTLNSGLEKIEFAAFLGCTALAELYIPASLTEIGAYAFQGCSGIKSIAAPDGNGAYRAKNNCLIHRESRAIVLACDNSVIPDDGSAERIEEYAFSNCKGMESLTVPEAIKGFGRYAFSGCSSLRNIQLPKSLCTTTPWDSGYGEGLFEGCSSLEYFEIPCWMTKISNGTFSGCESLKEIKIPDFVTNIGIGAFSGCKSLTELFIPKSVTVIGAEWGRPGSCDFIKGCTSLGSLKVEDGNPVYYSRDNCIIEAKTGTLLAITENGVIPDDGSITKIGENAFCACEGVTEISLPEGITEIGTGAFCEVKNLKRINVPKSVNAIGRDAFFESWKEFRPDVVEEENGVCYVGDWAVSTVRRRLPITESDNPFAATTEEALPESGAIAIREGTVGVCENAFSSSGIKSLSLPCSLKYIGDYAFNACSDLESVELREGLIGIGDAAFNCCEKLTSVTVPTTVKSIGRDAFRFCKGIQKLVIPDIEIEIGRDAFAYCTDIPSIDIPERILTRLTHFPSKDGEDEGGHLREAEVCEHGDEITADLNADGGKFQF